MAKMVIPPDPVDRIEAIVSNPTLLNNKEDELNSLIREIKQRSCEIRGNRPRTFEVVAEFELDLNERYLRGHHVEYAQKQTVLYPFERKLELMPLRIPVPTPYGLVPFWVWYEAGHNGWIIKDSTLQIYIRQGNLQEIIAGRSVSVIL